MDEIAEIAQLRSRVSQLEARLDYLFTHLNVSYVPDPDALNAPVIELLENGDYMSALRTYRDIHRVGLAEAKEAIDALQARLKG